MKKMFRIIMIVSIITTILQWSLFISLCILYRASTYSLVHALGWTIASVYFIMRYRSI